MTLNSGGAINSFDSASSSWVPIQSTLRPGLGRGQPVASRSILRLGNAAHRRRLVVAVGRCGRFNGPELVVDPGGIVNGAGIIEGPVANSGAILAGLPADPVPGAGVARWTFRARSVVPGRSRSTRPRHSSWPARIQTTFLSPMAQALCNLTTPPPFTGRSRSAGWVHQIILEGVSYASVTGYAYAGSAAGGALTIYAAGTAYTLSLAGDYDSSSFALSAVTNLDASMLLRALGSRLSGVSVPPHRTISSAMAHQMFFCRTAALLLTRF